MMHSKQAERCGVSATCRRLVATTPRRAWASTLAGRHGLTLFEVIISLMIFLMAMVPLWILVNFASERALDVQQQAEASLLCQSKLAEVISGAEPLQSSGPNSFSQDSAKDWQWRLDASEDVTGLWRVKVTVQKDRGDGSTFEVSLSQMVLDPSIRGSTLSSSTSGGSSGSSSSGDSGSSSGASSSNASGSSSSSSGGSAAKGGAATSSGKGGVRIGPGPTGNTGGAGKGGGPGKGGAGTPGGAPRGGGAPGTSRGSTPTIGTAPGSSAGVTSGTATGKSAVGSPTGGKQ